MTPGHKVTQSRFSSRGSLEEIADNTMKEWDIHLFFDAFAEKLMLTGKPVLMLPSMAFPGNKLS